MRTTPIPLSQAVSPSDTIFAPAYPGMKWAVESTSSIPCRTRASAAGTVYLVATTSIVLSVMLRDESQLFGPREDGSR